MYLLLSDLDLDATAKLRQDLLELCLYYVRADVLDVSATEGSLTSGLTCRLLLLPFVVVSDDIRPPALLRIVVRGRRRTRRCLGSRSRGSV